MSKEIDLNDIETINIDELNLGTDTVQEENVIEDVESEENNEFYDMLLDFVRSNNLKLSYQLDDKDIIRGEFIYDALSNNILLSTGHEELNKAFEYARTPRILKDKEDNILIYLGDTCICKVYK